MTDRQENKLSMYLALADAALPVSGALVAYAGVAGDQELAGNAAVTRSDFLRQRDSAALTTGQCVVRARPGDRRGIS